MIPPSANSYLLLSLVQIFQCNRSKENFKGKGQDTLFKQNEKKRYKIGKNNTFIFNNCFQNMCLFLGDSTLRKYIQHLMVFLGSGEGPVENIFTFKLHFGASGRTSYNEMAY